MHIPDECVTASSGKRVAAREKGKKFLVLNPGGKSIRKVQVDGCVVTDSTTPRCDVLFEIGAPLEKALYVELKGNDLKHACMQLSSTVKLFSAVHGDIPRHCYVVASSVPPVRTGTQVLASKFYRDNKVRVSFKTRQNEVSV